MAAQTVTLKTNVFLTLDDVKDWLKIKPANTEYDNKLKRLLNMATDKCEKYIQGPIKQQQFTETKDGDSSNTLVPDYYPVRSIDEIRVDYNRDFGDATIIQPDAYLLRKLEGVSSIGVKGTDIVIRDDSNTAIVGRIFIGSVVGSIQVKYTAGWGADADDIPYDIQQAVLILIEHFYLLRENRELNLKSKSNMSGQGYSKELGIPIEVSLLLDDYVDQTMGRNNLPQRNLFPI